MPDAQEDRFGCVWGATTNGRPDPQHAARMVEPYSRLRDLRRESIREAQEPRPTQRGGNAAGWMVWLVAAVVVGALIAWRIFG